MKAISKSYHIEIQTHRKNPYGLIRTSYREDGKVKHKTIATLSGLTLQQLRTMQAALQNKAVSKADFKVTASREYGASYAGFVIAKELGLHKIIHSNYSQDWVKASLAMIIGRLVFQGSKLALSNCTSYSSLWEVCGIGKVDVDVHCYEAMDKLFARQKSIQEALAERHLQEGTLVLYDITSCYMEGAYENSEIVDFGYNRDKKRGHAQMVISLLCNKDGCPIAVEVFRGNTKDETTVIDKINEMKQQYGLGKVVFVGDRGMITQSVYGKIDHETVKSISALKHSGIDKLLDKKRLVELTCAELDKIIASKRKTKYSKAVRIGRVLDKYSMSKFVILQGADDTVTYKLDTDKIARESALDGCYIVFTDVSSADMSALDTVKCYKSLIKVEQAFRNLKTAQLEMRPVYHKTDDRIKCHVFICMLAYYIMWHMKQRLKPLAESDGVGAGRKYSFDYVLECLKSIRKEDVRFMDADTSIVTVPNDEQERILNLLGVVV